MQIFFLVFFYESNFHLLAFALDNVIFSSFQVSSQDDSNVDVKLIKIVKKIGETVEESKLIEGALIDQKSMGHGGPVRIEKAKIGLIQFQISPPKTDVNVYLVFIQLIVYKK